ncbi:hypothetical protein ACP4OV_025376 [Aristida adscensionis]
MEVVLGALPSLLPKLAELLTNEYNLQKEVKGGIRFLKSELEFMQVALEKISDTPVDELDKQDKIWARHVRELSYDIEDKIDTFMVQVKGSEPDIQHGFKKFMDKTIRSLKQPKSRRQIAIDIRDIKCRVEEVAKRRDRYKINNVVARPVKVDPRALVRYEKMTELIGIDEARHKVISILTEGNEVSKQQDKIISIVGFGGLGKTTLAYVLYENLREQFDCSAFVSVSQTSNMDKLLEDIFYQLGGHSTASINVIDELRKFLDEKKNGEKKRYLIIIDDIWGISHWKIIKSALPDNNTGCRIITTTRILTVAEKIGLAYKMKPLDLHNSRILLYRRIFGSEDYCPDEQLAEVSERILKKCGGVPLAIITIASLLASKRRDKIEWYNVCNSISIGLEKNNLDVKNMRKILSLSYYDMPSYLRTCMLYLSVFPEDYKIKKDHLIWMWIAEGFIHGEEQGVALFELGESYLNELINRKKIRRLSLQNGEADHAAGAFMNMEQVRSVVVFPPIVVQMPALQNFKVLRVLDLQGFCLQQVYSLEYLGKLINLRYLGLRETGISQLPRDVENLRFLQTLDLKNNTISSLPSTIVRLRNLMCLWIEEDTRLPNGIKSLASLEDLSELSIHKDSTDIIEELGCLTKLRVLHIKCKSEWNDSLDKSLVKCLQKLQKIQSLFICVQSGGCNLDGWVAPRHLRRLGLVGCWFSLLPAWLNPTFLFDLSILILCVRELHHEDPEILRRLSGLRYVDLTVSNVNPEILERFAAGACSLPSLVQCVLWKFTGPLDFRQGAMPRLTAPLLVVAGKSIALLTPEVGAVVIRAVQDAWRRRSAQVSTLHVVSALLQHPSTTFFRDACIRSHSRSFSRQLHFKVLEICLAVAMDGLPASASLPHGWNVYCRRLFSDALHDALERMRRHHRGSIDTQQQPMLTGKIELKDLVISIPDDPIVSRVMRDAGFSSTEVKANVEQAVSDIEANNPASTSTAAPKTEQ